VFAALVVRLVGVSFDIDDCILSFTETTPVIPVRPEVRNAIKVLSRGRIRSKRMGALIPAVVIQGLVGS
jgi:hypothetical protein